MQPARPGTAEAEMSNLGSADGTVLALGQPSQFHVDV